MCGLRLVVQQVEGISYTKFMKNQNKSFSFILFVLAVLTSWGLSWPIMKLALRNTPPIWMGAMRMVMGSVILFGVLGFIGKKISLTRKDLPFLISVGLMQMGLYILLVNLGLNHVDAGRSVILVYTTPLWVTPIAVLFFKEPLQKLTALGLVLGLLGVILLFNPFSFDFSNKVALYGNGMLLLAALVWSFVIIHVRFGQLHRSPLELAPWQMLIATIFLVIMGCIFEPYPSINWSWSLLAEMSYIGPIATAFGFWGVLELNRRLPAVTTSLILLAVPVIGLLSSALILHEKITLNLMISMTLILMGLLCVSLDKKIKPKLSDSVLD